MIHKRRRIVPWTGVLLSFLAAIACAQTPSLTTANKASSNTITPVPTAIPGVAEEISLNCITNTYGPMEVCSNGIVFLIDEVNSYRCDPKRTPVTENHGYIYVIIRLRIINRNDSITVRHHDIVLVDEFENTYVGCDRNCCFDLPKPHDVAAQQEENEVLVYAIPLAAAKDGLRIAWECATCNINMEIVKPLCGQFQE